MTTAQERDAGVLRARRLTGWLTAGAIAVAGVTSAAVAHAQPGTHSRAQGASAPRSDTSREGDDNGGESLAPAPPPNVGSGAGVVTSGGS